MSLSKLKYKVIPYGPTEKTPKTLNILSMNTSLNLAKGYLLTSSLKKSQWRLNLALNQTKPAGIYASHRFRGGFVEKVCINWNFIDRFSSFVCITLFKLIAKPYTKFKVKSRIRKNYYTQKMEI